MRVQEQSLHGGNTGAKRSVMSIQVLDFAQVDSWRAQRTGFPEVVLGAGKSAEQIAAIMQQLVQNEQVVMATRISPEVLHYPILQVPASRSCMNQLFVQKKTAPTQ